MRKSETATKGIPYRTRTTIGTGPTHNGPWQPYSSMVEERVVPDRSHLIYTSRNRGEYIRVGRTIYSKGPDGSWAKNPREAEGILVNPASTPGFNGPIVEYWLRRSEGQSSDDAITIKVVSKETEEQASADTKTLKYFYHFGADGVLVRTESFSHNGNNWIRRTAIVEYDPEIFIDAPIK